MWAWWRSATSPAILVPASAYLLGSILPADLVARRRGVSLKEAGKNPGTGEIYRLFGLGPALLVFVIDAGKGILPLLAGRWFDIPWWAMFLTAVLAVAGHNWSIYYGFWGGKGLATATGVYIVLLPQLLTIALAPSLFAWWRTGWISASGVVGLPLIFALAWFRKVDPAAWLAASVIPLVILLAVRDWIGDRLADRRSARTS